MKQSRGPAGFSGAKLEADEEDGESVGGGCQMQLELRASADSITQVLQLKVEQREHEQVGGHLSMASKRAPGDLAAGGQSPRGCKEQALISGEELEATTTTTTTLQEAPTIAMSTSDTTSADGGAEITANKFICHECARPISDRYIMKLFASSSSDSSSSSNSNNPDDSCRLYHETCLKCSVCSRLLENSCFVRDSKLLCPQDYYE